MVVVPPVVVSVVVSVPVVSVVSVFVVSGGAQFAVSFEYFEVLKSLSLILTTVPVLRLQTDIAVVVLQSPTFLEYLLASKFFSSISSIFLLPKLQTLIGVGSYGEQVLLGRALAR